MTATANPVRPRPCERCKAPIVWARTLATESGRGGKLIPLNATPDPAGNVAVRPTGPGRLVARVLRKDESHDRIAETLFMPHFATCKAEPRNVIRDIEAYLADHANGGDQS